MTRSTSRTALDKLRTGFRSQNSVDEAPFWALFVNLRMASSSGRNFEQRLPDEPEEPRGPSHNGQTVGQHFRSLRCAHPH